MVDVPEDMWKPGYRAHLMTGTYLEPVIYDGSILIVDPSREPEDGDVVLAYLTKAGFPGLVIRFFRRAPAIIETVLLATDQDQHDPIIAAPCDMQIEGTVVGVVTPACRLQWDGLKFPVHIGTT
jgi:SOS-response transcriptional repressor LexA